MSKPDRIDSDLIEAWTGQPAPSLGNTADLIEAFAGSHVGNVGSRSGRMTALYEARARNRDDDDDLDVDRQALEAQERASSVAVTARLTEARKRGRDEYRRAFCLEWARAGGRIR